MIKALGRGILQGLATFDTNEDGKVTLEEIKNATVETWVKFIVSVTTSVLAVTSLI